MVDTHPVPLSNLLAIVQDAITALDRGAGRATVTRGSRVVVSWVVVVRSEGGEDRIKAFLFAPDSSTRHLGDKLELRFDRATLGSLPLIEP